MTDNADTVILIHGLWMPGLVLLPHQHWLRAEGFAVRRFSYPSWRKGLNENARSLSSFVNETSGEVIYLVAHSLGGLVVCMMLSQYRDARIKKVILMGTPYASCHCGFTLEAYSGLAPLVGRTFKDWFSLAHPALPHAIDIGVIAGTRSIGSGRLIGGLARPNDGLVALEETHIAGAKDSIALNVSHSGMLVSRACADQIIKFIRTGSFSHA